MRFLYSVWLLLALTVGVSWLNRRLLARLFPYYRGRLVRYAYLAVTAAAVFVMVFGWPRRPSFGVPEQEGYIYLVYAALAWLIGQLMLAVAQPLLYIVWRLLKGREEAAGGNSPEQPGLSRRAFLQGALAAAPLVAFGVGGKAIHGAQTELAVQRYALTMPGLPAGLDGFKIGQVSDTHVGPYFDLARLDAVLARLAAEKPDLLVVTGDFADDLRLLGPAVDKLAALQASIPHGVYFCWGNHEYFRDIALVRSELERGRIKILENSSALIVPGERPFYLLGVDYPPSDAARRSIHVSAQMRGQYVAAAMRAVPADAFKVLIAHHPDFLIDGFGARIPLTLAGHTHGGQVVIGGKSLVALHTYVRGLYRESGVYGYVNSGAGHWFPFRLGCPPEVSVFTLRV